METLGLDVSCHNLRWRGPAVLGRGENFPLLVRIHQDFFDFSQAESRGEDIRFSANGKPLAYQIEHWNATGGHAAVWSADSHDQGK